MKCFQMTRLYNKIFHFKALQNMPKSGFWSEMKPSGNPVSLFPKYARYNWRSSECLPNTLQVDRD
jgi:hypothetical protein